MIVFDRVYQYGLGGFKSTFGDIYDQMIDVVNKNASKEDVVESIKAHDFHKYFTYRADKTIAHIKNCQNF